MSCVFFLPASKDPLRERKLDFFFALRKRGNLASGSQNRFKMMTKLLLDGTRDFKSTDLINCYQYYFNQEFFVFAKSNSVKIFFRYKYLEKMHEEEMKKILVYLKGFSNNERNVLAQITALWLAGGQISPAILPILIHVSLKSYL